MTRQSLRLLPLVAVAILASGAALFAADNNVGTWTLDLAQSRFSPGPAPRTQILKIEVWATDGVKVVSDGTDAEGRPTHYEFQAKYDGQDAFVRGNPDFDVLSYKRVDPYTLVATTKLNGKITQNTRVVVSRDGKTRTLIQLGTNAKGAKVDNVVVYTRQ
jgi:hypothetical protein